MCAENRRGRLTENEDAGEEGARHRAERDEEGTSHGSELMNAYIVSIFSLRHLLIIIMPYSQKSNEQVGRTLLHDSRVDDVRSGLARRLGGFRV